MYIQFENTEQILVWLIDFVVKLGLQSDIYQFIPNIVNGHIFSINKINFNKKNIYSSEVHQYDTTIINMPYMCNPNQNVKTFF